MSYFHKNKHGQMNEKKILLSAKIFWYVTGSEK